MRLLLLLLRSSLTREDRCLGEFPLSDVAVAVVADVTAGGDLGGVACTKICGHVTSSLCFAAGQMCVSKE